MNRRQYLLVPFRLAILSVIGLVQVMFVMFVKLALGFIKELTAKRGSDMPLPEMIGPWYEYGRNTCSR